MGQNLTPGLDLSTFDRAGRFSRKSSCAISQSSIIELNSANYLREILAKIHSSSPFKKNAELPTDSVNQLALGVNQPSDFSKEHSLWHANVSPITQVDEIEDGGSPLNPDNALYRSF